MFNICLENQAGRMNMYSDDDGEGILISLVIEVLHWRQKLWVSAFADSFTSAALAVFDHDLPDRRMLGLSLAVRVR